MFRKVLIANRGEIACRVMRTCRGMGIQTVAVYSDADAEALHVTEADQAFRIGPAPSRDSYLSIDAILAAAKACGAEAIHPGYGFLSENADFAQAVVDAGLVFIGPAPGTVRLMAAKDAAKRAMEEASVPVIPGATEDMADSLGLPLLVKPAAGGGGKGMIRVNHPEDLPDALARARREAEAAFGDGRLMVECALDGARHVEVQVFADTHGNVVHLFERDCSVQRRHQKIIEEAPAPGIDETTRQNLGDTAVTAARAIGYRGAGTVEFLLDSKGAFFFLEMNTRLQVEHPVTEAITGLDLVEWQILVAAGAPLPRKQSEITRTGHAIEARLYAEDPANGFAPAPGRIDHLRLPEGEGLRIDTGVREGDTVSVHYDPMIAKISVNGRNRIESLERFRTALGQFDIVGPVTNLDFLRAVARHPDFGEGGVDVRFVERELEALLPCRKPPPPSVLAAACLFRIAERTQDAHRTAGTSSDPHSPWSVPDRWRLGGAAKETFEFRHEKTIYPVAIHPQQRGMCLILPGGDSLIQPTSPKIHKETDFELTWTRDDQPETATVTRKGTGGFLSILWNGRIWRLEDTDGARDEASDEAIPTGVRAPLPGIVSAVLVRTGDRVKADQPLLRLEAMKVEHTLTAPSAGRITALHTAIGNQVDEGADLMGFEAMEG